MAIIWEWCGVCEEHTNQATYFEHYVCEECGTKRKIFSEVEEACQAEDAPDLRSELTTLLNKHSRENVSNTPDFILRDYIWNCLKAFEASVKQRDDWYGISPSPGKS